MHINVKIFHAFLYTFQGLADSLLAKGQGHETDKNLELKEWNNIPLPTDWARINTNSWRMSHAAETCFMEIA